MDQDKNLVASATASVAILEKAEELVVPIVANFRGLLAVALMVISSIYFQLTAFILSILSKPLFINATYLFFHKKSGNP